MSDLPSYYFDKPWSFRHRSYRSRATATDEVTTLLTRLELTPEQIKLIAGDHDVMRMLVRYCMDFPLNITWYQRATAYNVWQQRVAGLFVITLSILALIVTAVPAVLPSFGGKTITEQTSISAQIAVFVTATFGILRILAIATDRKACIGTFWKASADLKEALFTFEEVWRKKVLNKDSSVSQEFITALLGELRFARKVARTERDSYFSAFNSPVDMVNTVSTGIDLVRTRRQDVTALQVEQATARRVKEEAVAKKLGDLQDKIIEAKAKVLSQESKLAELKKLPTEGRPDSGEIAKTELALLEARTEHVRLQAVLTAAYEADAMTH
jgi:hypothetical protein